VAHPYRQQASHFSFPPVLGPRLKCALPNPLAPFARLRFGGRDIRGRPPASNSENPARASARGGRGGRRGLGTWGNGSAASPDRGGKGRVWSCCRRRLGWRGWGCGPAFSARNPVPKSRSRTRRIATVESRLPPELMKKSRGPRRWGLGRALSIRPIEVVHSTVVGGSCGGGKNPIFNHLGFPRATAA